MNFSNGIILHENETGINLSINCSTNNQTTPKNAVISTSSNHRPWDFWDISLLFLVIFGLIGNILSIIVMNRIRIRNTNANLFVTSMAITDCLFLTIKFFSNIVKLYRIPIFTACIAIHHVLPHTILFVSVWLVILTALERAVAVHYPLRVARLFSPNRCKFFITIMCVVFFLVSNTTTPCLDYHKNMTSLCMIKGSIKGKCFNFYTYVFPWVKAALGAWIPSVLGILLNAIIARGVFSASRVRKSMSVNSDMPKKIVQNTTLSPCTSEHLLMKSNNSKNLMIATNYIPKQSVSSQRDSPLLGNHNHHQNNKSSSSSSSEKQLTIMLMTISISFMILSFPHSAFELMRKLNFQFAFLRDRQANRFVLFFLDVQHATNFILYCLTGRKFRNELLNMLLLRWRPMPNKIRRDTLLSGATI